MSGSETESGAPAMVAAEYVLGTLEREEAEAARARLALDRVFAAEVRFWEERLYPLSALVAEVSPPASLWARIEDTTGGVARVAETEAAPGPANDNRLGRWRVATFASLAVAASLAVFIGTRPTGPSPSPSPSPAFAVLSPAGSTAPVLVALAEPDGAILVRPSSALAVASGHDLQLWALAAGQTRPVSLGVLPAAGTQVPPGVAPGTQLLVSLEPKGGSPTGLPTGPVVYGGTLRRLE